jgi:hypothetical protein
MHIIDGCDNFPHKAISTTENVASVTVFPLYLTYSDGCQSKKALGWLRPHIADAISHYFKGSEIVPFLREQTTKEGKVFWCFEEEFLRRGVDEVTEGMARMLRTMKDQGLFKQQLDG